MKSECYCGCGGSNEMETVERAGQTIKIGVHTCYTWKLGPQTYYSVEWEERDTSGEEPVVYTFGDASPSREDIDDYVCRKLGVRLF